MAVHLARLLCMGLPLLQSEWCRSLVRHRKELLPRQAFQLDCPLPRQHLQADKTPAFSRAEDRRARNTACAIL